MQVYSVEQRPRNASLIISGTARSPAAGQRWIPEMATSAGVHRGNELDPRREGDVSVGTGDADVARLQWLSKRIEHCSLEFWKLIEEQDVEVGQADLARPNLEAASNQRRHRRAVVWGPERTTAPNFSASQLASDGSDHRHFERLARLQWRKNARKACGEQRFARARRAAHQEVVA